MRIALPLGQPMAGKVSIEDLAGEDWLCGALPSSCRDQVLELCRDAGFEPRISFRSEDYEVIKGFVAAGLGVTILPELAGGHPGIELRTVRGRKPIRRVWAVTREHEARSPAAVEMLGILREVCRIHGDDVKLALAA
jgi:DNA-binding transcriptional LysR family regulator